MRDDLDTSALGSDYQPSSVTRQLLSLSRALAGAWTPDAVTEAVADYAVANLGASEAAVLIGRSEGEATRLVAGQPLDDGGDRAHGHHPAGRTAVLPLRNDERTIGALTVSFAGEGGRPASPEILLAVADQCAVALGRALAIEAERRALAELRAENEAKSLLLAMLSHELRTPLNSILGFIDLVDGIAGPVADRQHEYLRRARASARHLSLLVEDLLTLSRVDAGQTVIHLEPTTLGAVVRDAASMVEETARAKQIELRLDVPADESTTLLDATKIRQILVNLLSNAIKFTDQGWVAISARRDTAGLILQVRDTGMGIAPENLERVFDPFWQADQKGARQLGGIGIGLNVSARLARFLGGSLRATSTIEGGSTFTLVLPHPLRERNTASASPSTAE